MARAGIAGRVRAICTALPGVTERLSHGAPAFFAGKQFVMLEEYLTPLFPRKRKVAERGR